MATLKQLVDETTTIKNELVTCHTTLKNNLLSKGVTVGSNDKIPIMINKINEISTGIEIKYSTSLPSAVKNGDFYVISDVTPNNIYIKHYEGENTSLDNAGSYNNGDILVLFDKTVNGITTVFDFTSKQTRITLNVMKVLQVIDNKYVQVEVYEGKNDSWVQVVNKELVVYNNGVFMQEILTGDMSTYDVSGHNGTNSHETVDRDYRLGLIPKDTYLLLDNLKKVSDSYGSLYKSYFSSKEIDFTPYRRLLIEYECVQNEDVDANHFVDLGVNTIVTNDSMPTVKHRIDGRIAVGTKSTIDLDISTFSKIGRLHFRLYIHRKSGKGGFQLKITKISLLT